MLRDTSPPVIFAKRLNLEDTLQLDYFNLSLYHLSPLKWYPWILSQNYLHCLGSTISWSSWISSLNMRFLFRLPSPLLKSRLPNYSFTILSLNLAFLDKWSWTETLDGKENFGNKSARKWEWLDPLLQLIILKPMVRLKFLINPWRFLCMPTLAQAGMIGLITLMP